MALSAFHREIATSIARTSETRRDVMPTKFSAVYTIAMFGFDLRQGEHTGEARLPQCGIKSLDKISGSLLNFYWELGIF